ncbi:hypothetical protein KQX54_006320 [Cotesia glomerata]|uniref:Uncharacterized protein n=1 Tax=Cotesia glomerata TaxID=32391 RepID=A0AAV7HPP9_COTGL|nr:hypothetical protein KQX54_006320 [Cotesia glomerata]
MSGKRRESISREQCPEECSIVEGLCSALALAPASAAVAAAATFATNPVRFIIIQPESRSRRELLRTGPVRRSLNDEKQMITLKANWFQYDEHGDVEAADEDKDEDVKTEEVFEDTEDIK